MNVTISEHPSEWREVLRSLPSLMGSAIKVGLIMAGGALVFLVGEGVGAGIGAQDAFMRACDSLGAHRECEDAMRIDRLRSFPPERSKHQSQIDALCETLFNSSENGQRLANDHRCWE